MVLVPSNDISGSPRPDGTLSASHSRQNSPKRLVIMSQYYTAAIKYSSLGTDHSKK